MNKRLITLLHFIFIFKSLHLLCAQQSMVLPVDHPVRLSGTFGELRTNHFHTGIDIKSSRGTIGDPIKTVWDGYISRIHIDIAGYGNALYVDHPNGMTTVYAHLHKFNPTLDSFLMQLQYSQQTFEIDTILPDTLFKVYQGDVIGQMGSSGYSFGPHLHFEIRNTTTERPINPLNGFVNIDDTIGPKVRSLYIYTLDQNKDVVVKKRLRVSKNKSGYYINKSPLKVDGSYVAFGVETYDQANKSPNKNGIYAVNITVDGDPFFAFELDSLNFDYKSLINTHIDYDVKKNTGRQIHRCLLYDVGHPHLGNVITKGALPLQDSIPQSIQISIADINGNQSNLSLQVIGTSNSINPPTSWTNTYIPFFQNVQLDLGNLTVTIDRYSFEKDVRMLVDTLHDRNNNDEVILYQIGRDNVPLLKPMRLRADLSNIPVHLRSKYFIGRCSKGKYQNHGSLTSGNTIYTDVTRLGDYAILVDTIAPKIIPKKWDADWSRLKYVSFKIVDNVDAKSKANDLITHATIDDQWLLFKYDYKNQTIRYNMDIALSPGPHTFILTVVDDLNNESTFKEIINIK